MAQEGQGKVKKEFARAGMLQCHRKYHEADKKVSNDPHGNADYALRSHAVVGNRSPEAEGFAFEKCRHVFREEGVECK